MIGTESCVTEIRNRRSVPAFFQKPTKPAARSPWRFQHGLDAIPQPVFATFPRAVGAAKNFAAVFHTVADDFAPAVITFGRNNVDRALEAVEDVRFPLNVTSNVLSYSFPQCSHLAISLYSIFTFCFAGLLLKSTRHSGREWAFHSPGKPSSSRGQRQW